MTWPERHCVDSSCLWREAYWRTGSTVALVLSLAGTRHRATLRRRCAHFALQDGVDTLVPGQVVHLAHQVLDLQILCPSRGLPEVRCLVSNLALESPQRPQA